MIITIAEARSYAHDYESTDEDILSYILTAEKYIAEGVGAVDPADPRVKLLAKLIVCELDDVRTLSGAEANSTRHLVESIKRQLRTVARVSKLDTNGTAP